MYFSIRKPTEDERHGARPPAVKIATFAYDLIWFGLVSRARDRVCGRCAARPRRRRGRAVIVQIWLRICRPSAVNGRAASAARLTRSRLPAALDRATGPRERCHRRAAAAEMEDFPCCRPSGFVSSDGLKSHRASSRGVAHVPVSAACGIHTCCWCVLQSRGGICTALCSSISVCRI